MKIEITNKKNEKRIFTLTYSPNGEYALSDVFGFTQDYNIGLTQERSPFQQGATTVALRGEPRPLSFVYHMFKTGRKQLDVEVEEIVRFLNPYLGEVRIVYDSGNRRRAINAYFTGHTFVDYPEHTGYGSLSLDFLADEALFEDENFQFVPLGETPESFTLPITLPVTLGATVAATDVINDGDHSFPVEIIFNGPLTNPKLIRDVYDINENVIRTDEISFVNLNVPDNWSVRINTRIGREEAVLIDGLGNEENINRFLTPESNYFQIHLGKNVVRFETSVGNPVTELKFKKKYITA